MAYEKENVCNSGGGDSGYRFGWILNWLVVIATAGILIGCTTIKKAGITSIAAGVGATAGSVFSTGVAAPILGAMTTAFVADAVTEAIPIGQTGKKVMNDCAPDNFWSTLGSLIEMGGWALILIFLLPIVIGWVLPGPTKLNRK